jgi:hypothetical protein
LLILLSAAATCAAVMQVNSTSKTSLTETMTKSSKIFCYQLGISTKGLTIEQTCKWSACYFLAVKCIFQHSVAVQQMLLYLPYELNAIAVNEMHESCIGVVTVWAWFLY